MRYLSKIILLSTITILLLFSSCSEKATISKANDITSSTNQVSALLDSFNVAAANADYQRYFNYYADNAIFAGTDATERWNKKDFMVWAKPYFDKGRAWNFKAIDRHIYFDSTGNTAWFDELLNTQMKICRGSGVLIKQGETWKVQQYILSTTVPNDLIDAVIKMKAPVEDSIILASKR